MCLRCADRAAPHVGKRTLAKLNAFDFVVTIAIGSTLAPVLLSATVALAEGITALALLVVLQYVVASVSAPPQPPAPTTGHELGQYREQFGGRHRQGGATHRGRRAGGR